MQDQSFSHWYKAPQQTQPSEVLTGPIFISKLDSVTYKFDNFKKHLLPASHK